MEENTSNLCVYVLVRTDITSLTNGKIAAQVHHAGVQMLSKYANNPVVKQYIASGQTDGADHFATTIVLSANVQDIEVAMARVKHIENCVYDIIIDPAYPFLVDPELTIFLTANPELTYIHSVGDRDLFTRHELTVAWALGDRNNATFRSVFENLKLLS